MASKFSEAHNQCKPCTGSTNTYKKGTILEEGAYPFIGGSCSSSAHVWEFSNHPCGIFVRDLGWSVTPRRHESSFGLGNEKGKHHKYLLALVQRSKLQNRRGKRAMRVALHEHPPKASQHRFLSPLSSPIEEWAQYPYMDDVRAQSFGGFHQPRGTFDKRFVEGSTRIQSPIKDDDASTSIVEFAGLSGFQTTKHKSSIFMVGFSGFHMPRHASTSYNEIVEEEEEEYRK